jgi:SAM-dependent methyltransferase
VSVHPPGYEGRFDRFGWYLIGAVIRLKKTLGSGTPRLVDLGMGRGRDVIYFSRRGFRVLGIDISPKGIEKARRRAARYKIPLRTQLGDLRTVRLKGRFHVVFSSTFANHLLPKIRSRRFAHFRSSTLPGGINAITAFISRPDLKPAPDLDPDTMLFRSGELRTYYRGWDIIDSRMLEFACEFGDSPHHHVADVIVARKPK